MKKFLFDLTEDDIKKIPVWYFPMSENMDELTVCTPDESMEVNHLKIVSTVFLSNNKKEHVGYIFFSNEPKTIKDIKPVIIYGEKNLTFWKGIRKPSEYFLNEVNSEFGFDFFPVSYKAVHNNLGLSVSGEIQGFYYLDENKQISCLKP